AAAFEAAQAAHGVARILVHAAADGTLQTLLQPDGSAAPATALARILDTNVLGTLLVVQAFAARLVAAGGEGVRGVAIAVSSIGAADGVVGCTYAASKGAIDALALSLARELSPRGIRVVTIAPGGIDTEMFRAGAVPGTHAIVASQTLATRRLGTPEEFAGLVRHVCENDYLNGCVIRLDGGMRIPYSFDVGGGAREPETR
ncbi:MAG TPA: SDR family oxidoreductase, partial [Nevskiaceae bacterium]|nr:SDR family oxidoreductase [Nevskiaceae bacterium]